MIWQRQILGALTLIAVLVAGVQLWRAASRPSEQPGLRVILEFDDASGLRAGCSVRHRGVDVGEVESIELSSEARSVRVRCRIESSIAPNVRSNTRFWIVRPEFRGITQGATGLDTIIRDPYLAFVTPVPEGEPAKPLEVIVGLTTPPDSAESAGLSGATEPGDLEFTVLFSENRDLRVGARVLHRGMPVGSIDSVSLVERGVAIKARIRREFRPTVRSDAEFWIARPEFTAGWTGIQIHELSGILAQPYLAYYSPDGAVASPAIDGQEFYGLSERPNVKWSGESTRSNPAPPIDRTPSLRPSIARVHYTFSESDTWSPDDKYRFELPGLVWIGKSDEAFVVVAAPAIDGAARVDDAIGDPEITHERWQVELVDGSVIPAEHAWTGEHLALLRLQGPLPMVNPPPLVFGPVPSGPAEALGLDTQGDWSRTELSIEEGCIDESVFVYSLIYGARGAFGFVLKKSTVIPLEEIPSTYRPAG